MRIAAEREHMLTLHVLASGSGGNAAVVEDSSTGHGLLIDCGISKKALMEACQSCRFDPRGIDGLLITHDHADHVKGIGVALRGLDKLGCTPAIYLDPKVHQSLPRLQDDLAGRDLRWISPGQSWKVGSIGVQAFATSHDAAASYGFRFDLQDCPNAASTQNAQAGSGNANAQAGSGNANAQAGSGNASAQTGAHSIGFMTDTGVVTGSAHECLQNVDILAIEANHDPDMLKRGPYPYPVKQRIASDKGHLSNPQSAQELRSLLGNRLAQVVAMHVSQNNNLYELALSSLQQVLTQEGHPAVARVAFQSRPTSHHA